MTQIEKQIEFQKRAEEAHIASNYRSTIAGTMGSGKSVVAINRIKKRYKQKNQVKVLFFGSRILYLENFKKELLKFDGEYLLNNITFMCTQSLKNVEEVYDVIICDEAHKLVKTFVGFLASQLLKNPKVEILCMTATPATNGFAARKLLTICPISIELDVNEGIDSNLTNDFIIHLLPHKLSKIKDIHVKTGKYNFYTSEFASYRSITNAMNKKIKHALEAQEISGVEIIPDLTNEKKYAKRLLGNLNSKRDFIKSFVKTLEGRTLIYAGSIAHSETYGFPFYHSKLKVAERKEFMDNLYNGKYKVAVNVDSIKESLSIPGLKNLILTNIGSSESELKQIVGRALRLVPNLEVANIYILLAENTIEEEWCKRAIKFVKPENIRHGTN